MRHRIGWFEIALTIVFLSATLFAAFSDAYNLPNRWFIRDDAYYYFKVAQNISEGRGSTFDGIHPTNGYHPLWLLVCIPIFAFARFDIILPLRILAIVTGILQLGTAILFYRLIRRAISEPAGMLAACFWAFNTYVLVFLYKTGVESSITIFLILALLYALFKFERRWRDFQPALGQVAFLGVLAILVTFGRLDLIFFSLLIGVWIVFRATPIRYLLPLDILALVVATIVAFIARLGFAAYYDVANSAVIVLTTALVVKIPTLYLMGMYEPPSTWRVLPLLGRLLASTLVGAILSAIILLGGNALGSFPAFSRAVLLLDAGLTFGLLLSIRALALLFRMQASGERPRSPMDDLRSRWRGWLKEGAVFYGVVGGALSVYMLWNRLAFGTFMPVSGQIKHWWGTFTHSIYGTAASNWPAFFALDPFSDLNAWAPPTRTIGAVSNQVLYPAGTDYGTAVWQTNYLLVLLVCLLVVLAVLLLRRRSVVRAAVQTGMIPLFVGSWLQILAYNVTGYASAKEWYWLLEPVLLVLVGSALVKVLSRVLLLRWRWTRLVPWAVVAWYGVSGAVGYWRDAYALNPYGQHPPGTPYSPIIPFLEEHTEPGALIGMTGGGNVGYLMPSRTIVNMDGLINSYEYFEALQAGTAADYLYDTGLRYVFANPTLLAANPYRGQYSDRLESLVDWGGKDLLRLLPRAED